MLLKQMKSGKLDVKVFSNRAEMGHSAASDVAGCIRSLLAIKDCIYIVFAAAPSQNELLDALVFYYPIDGNFSNRQLLRCILIDVISCTTLQSRGLLKVQNDHDQPSF